MTADYLVDGYVRLPRDARVAAWSDAALRIARGLPQTSDDLRHGRTWRVGVDALPNAADGSVAGVTLRGPWEALVDLPKTWHKAQLSVVYPGYPRQDADESDAAHRYRLMRDAAHVDGLLPEGPDRRRHLREPHAFILGLPLNMAAGSPLVVWKGSHTLMRRAFEAAFHSVPPEEWGDVDVTDVYQAARRDVFERCDRVELPARPGEATLLHRLVLHGVAPWGDAPEVSEGRKIAYFRPEVVNPVDWLHLP